MAWNSSRELMENYKYLGDFICHLSSYKCYQGLFKNILLPSCDDSRKLFKGGTLPLNTEIENNIWGIPWQIDQAITPYISDFDEIAHKWSST